MARLTTNAPKGFRPVPRTGVIYVMTEASRRGYQRTDTNWANLGQGAPETGHLPNSPERITSIVLDDSDNEYAPIDGLPELRDAVANLYNQRYRQKHKSKYRRENVAISAGGRIALTRLVSTLGRTNVGHFLPDYTAYEELLDAFGTFSPIPILLDPSENYSFSSEQLRKEILGRGLSAILLSNPCNPTGKMIYGSELEQWVAVAREIGCTIILDEFYSHYTYASDCLSVSAAAYVEDVNRDPIVIVDGLTKNWRYPGFRVCWTVGPESIIEGVSSAGSFLDGGCARPMQKVALRLVSQDVADKEARAIKETFSTKRDYLFNNLLRLGISVNPAPFGGFYCWGDLSGLPKNLQNGMSFFERALDAKTIVVPGEFFDINPGRRRAERPSRFQNYVRFSFGPPLEEIERGISSIEKFL
ncbi:MAG: pyridoxal phosphate-dependent aminotransferase [Deltaproteobacteria bacterium]|nr:pyridoxal phosphate-dependent aminotransferase [Deltaproteobacteria bacterium]